MARAGAPLAREALSALSGASGSVKALCLLLVAGYALSFSSGAREALAVTPGHFWPPDFCVWTALTHAFLEVHFWELAIDVCVVALVGKLLEPLWGAVEMAVFFLVVNVGVAMSGAFFYYLLYMVTLRASLLFGVHIHGLAGYLAGVSVAVKQVMPDYVLYRSPVGKITNRNVPLLLFLLTCALWAGGTVEGSYCTMFGSGLLISWTYLRFYQVHANGSRGDLADSFAFHTFFPNVLQPPIAFVSNSIFAVLVGFRLCLKPVRRYDMGASGAAGSGSSASISISLPGAESHDTERRRQIALKALSERLNKGDPLPDPAGGANGDEQSGATSAWPSLDDAPENKGNIESVHVPIEKSAEMETALNAPESGDGRDPKPFSDTEATA